MDWYDTWQKSRGAAWKPTELSPEEAKKFKQDLTSHPWFQELKKEIAVADGVNLTDEQLLADLLGPNSDYDYAGAWKAGVMPEPYAPDGGAYHWVSSANGKMLKSLTHPTAWMEYFMRETGQDPAAIGLHTPEEARVYTDLRAAKRGS